MIDVLPAILAKSEQEFRDKLTIAETLAPVIHLDVMDGHFVPNSTWFDPVVIAGLSSRVSFELHLMVSDPTSYIGAIQDADNIARIIWHIEVPIGHDVLINWCKKLKIEAGLAISPETPVSRLEPFAHHVKELLVMGVKPGLSGQQLIPQTLETVVDLHKLYPETVIGFDGGVRADVIPRLVTNGASRVCAASAIFDTEDPKLAFAELQRT